MAVGRIALEPPNGDRLTLYAAHALSLTLALLRADTAADGRQGICLRYLVKSGLCIAVCDERYKFRNLHIYRAAGNTGAVFAVEAALSLLAGLLVAVAKCDLVKVFIPYIRFLFLNRNLFITHIGHVISAFSFIPIKNFVKAIFN